MAYYDAFIAAWNSVTQPPAGVTGTGLTAQMTTAQKLAALDAWTITGSIPTTLYVTGVQLLNCINWTEFNALTAQQQSNLLLLCAVPGLHLGGSANTAFITDGMILAYFNVAGPTVAALTALAQGTVQPWWQANGYPRQFDLGDCGEAGVS
jgi:hypothetical protein